MKLSIKAMIAITIMILIASVCFAGDKVPTHQSIDWNRYEYEEFLLWVKFKHLGISSVKYRPVKVPCVKKIRVVHEKTRLLT